MKIRDTMKAQDIKKVGVVGAGTMGNGIAHVFAQFGYQVVLVDVADDLLDKATATIDKNLGRQVKKEIITEQQKAEILARIEPTTDLQLLSGAQLVVEAIVEKMQPKLELMQKLGQLLPKDSIIASNTSSISITSLAKATGRPDKALGMHFMNPVPVMKLVEIIKGVDTAEDTAQTIVEITEKLNKVPVLVNDYPGFVSNRVLMPLINEAAFALMEGVAEAEAIDTVMKLGMNHPMGPLTLADFIGLDVVVDILDYLYRELGDPKFRACPLLRKKVEAGHLGRKSGRGFYDYSK